VKLDQGRLQAVESHQVDQTGELERTYRDLKFDLQRCAFYHGMRARFFDTTGKIISLVSVVAGAGAFSSLVSGSQYVISILACITAFFSGLNIIVGFSRRGRDHEILRGKYYSLMIDLERARKDVEKLREVEFKKLGFFADGPIFFTALDLLHIIGPV